jgi:hypothetical protein
MLYGPNTNLGHNSVLFMADEARAAREGDGAAARCGRLLAFSEEKP